MRIALVSHPCPVLLHGSEPWSPVRTNTWPQSQIALAAALQDEFDIRLLDLRSLFDPTRWRSRLGPEYLPKLRYGDYSLTRHLLGNYRDRIAACSADIYVVTANFTAEANAVAETIRTIKVLWPKALVLVGGRDATAPKRHTFYFQAGADYIGIGDGDTSLRVFLAALKQGDRPTEKIIEGGIPREFRPNLPDFSLPGLVLARYTESGGGPMHPGVFATPGFAAYVETSRGCPRECDFCTEARTDRWALDVPEAVVLIRHYIAAGCRLVGVTDDNVLIRQSGELIEIFTRLRELGVVWEFPSGLEVQLLTDASCTFKENLFNALFWNNGDEARFAGAHRLLVPLEDALLKRSGLTKLKRVQHQVSGLVHRLLDTGIPFFNIAIMIGDVMETVEDRKRLEGRLEVISEMVRGHSTRVNFSLFCTSPLPGTPFGRLIYESGRLAYAIEEAPELWTVATSVVNGTEFSAVETTRYRRQILERFGMLQLEGKVKPPQKGV